MANHVRDLSCGMVSDLAVKNCWTIAEHAGHKSPDRLQHLLRAAVWDEDGITADLRGYVTEHLGEQDALLIVDETGDLKKGNHTVGVQRQYTGTAGRTENAQVAVYLTYATRPVRWIRHSRPFAARTLAVRVGPGYRSLAVCAVSGGSELVAGLFDGLLHGRIADVALAGESDRTGGEVDVDVEDARDLLDLVGDFAGAAAAGHAGDVIGGVGCHR